MSAYRNPWAASQAEIDANIARTAQRRAHPATDWRKPTGDTRHLVIVGRNEQTCLRCGETFGVFTRPVAGESAFCWRCGGKVGVPTTSYLREGEYEGVSA